MRRADGAPWDIVGLYSFWTDCLTGEIVPNFTMPTINADGHVLFKQLHKHDPKLSDDAQDKRAVVPLHPEDWETWLYGGNDEEQALLLTQPPRGLRCPAGAVNIRSIHEEVTDCGAATRWPLASIKRTVTE